MTKEIIEKNFALSADFNRYAIKHPNTTANLPRRACLVFEDTSDNNLTKANRKLANEMTKEGKKCFRAIKDGNRWNLEPML